MAMPGRTDNATRGSGGVRIDDLDPRGRGVGRAGGKMTFVHGALPGEEVICRRVKRRRTFDEAVVQEVVESSPDRVEPRCRFYERCGGCSLQHLSYDAQLRHKERTLLSTLATVAGVSPPQVMPPLAGSPWRYRRKARLGARFVPGRYGALVGFRERLPNRVADMTDCEVLADPLGPLVMPLRELVGALEARARVPQIEVAAGKDGAVCVIRHLDPLSPEDLVAIEAFATRHRIGIWLQPGGPETARPVVDSTPDLHYSLEDGAIRLSFSPLDFVQVNAEVNRALVRRVVSMLAPVPGEKVLDAYCGLGNFSLPLAARGADVTAAGGGRRDGRACARERDRQRVVRVLPGRGSSETTRPCGTGWVAGGPSCSSIRRGPGPRWSSSTSLRPVRRASCTSRAIPTRWRATPRGSCTGTATA